MDPIDGALEISVKLTAAQWNTVLDLVANGPWRVAEPLMKAITSQVFAAANAAQTKPPNGAAAAEGETHVSN